MVLPIQWNNSAAQASLAPVASSPEYVIPLWWYSGAVFATGSATSAGVAYAKKGATNFSTTITSVNQFHYLNPAWSSTTKFALEVSMYTSATGGTAYVALFDLTNTASPVIVAGSTISTTLTTISVLRSAQLSLIPGHSYGISIWTNSTSYTAYATDASLIVFP